MSRDPSRTVSDAEARAACDWLSQYVAFENPDHRERLMADLATLTVWVRQRTALAGGESPEPPSLRAAAESVEADLMGNADSRVRGGFVLVEKRRVDGLLAALDALRGEAPA